LKKASVSALVDSLLSPTLALGSFLALLEVLDAFQVTYYSMIRLGVGRRTFSLGFSPTLILVLLSVVGLGHLVSNRRFRSALVPISALVVSYPLVGLDVSVAIYSIMLVAVILFHTRGFEDYLLWILVLLSVLEGIALLYWVFNVPSPPLYWFANLEHALYGISSIFAPHVTIIAMLMWIIKPLIERYVCKLRKRDEDEDAGIEIRRGSFQLEKYPILFIAIIIAVIGAIYPFIPHINPESVLIGTDLPRIDRIMEPMEDAPLSAFTIAGGSRPLFFLTAYAFRRVTGLESLEALKCLPILLLPLLSLSVYFMVSRASRDDEWASLSALFTTLGFNVTVGLYAYFMANILGLTLIFFAIGFLFRDLDRERPFPVAASFLASLVIFTHPWTFTQYYAPIGIIGLILFYKYLMGERNGGFTTILFFLGTTGLVNILKRILLGGMEGVGALITTAPIMLRLDNFWINNVYTFRRLYGGLLSNVLILIISAVGIYVLNNGKAYQFFLKILIAISSIYYLVNHGTLQVMRGHIRPRNILPSRLIFNIPFGVIMALSVLYLLRNSQLRKRSQLFTFVFIILSMSVYLFRSVVNLVY